MDFEGVNVIVVIEGGGGRKRSKLGYGDLPVSAEACVLEDLGDLCANCGVEEGNTTTNFAAERVVKGVVVWALRAVE